MYVYLDLAFLINFLFDAEILFLTLKITSKRIVIWRILLAALVGGLQGVFVFFPYFRILSVPPISLLTPLFMLGIALGKTNILIEYVIFLVISFIFGGAMSFFNFGAAFGLILIIPVYMGIMKIRRNIFKKQKDITLYYKDRIIRKNAVYDSGNSVFYFGKPVIFGNRHTFCEILDKNTIENSIYEEINPDDLCVVPYKSLGKSGVAAGIRLEKAVVSGKNFDGAVICYFDDNKNEVVLNGIMI